MPVASAKRHSGRHVDLLALHSRANARTGASIRRRWARVRARVLRVFRPRMLQALARLRAPGGRKVQAAARDGPTSARPTGKHRSAAIVTPPAPALMRRSMKSRSTTALRLASFALPISRLSIARVAALVRPGVLAIGLAVLVDQVGERRPFGTGANPPPRCGGPAISTPAAQSFASRFLECGVPVEPGAPYLRPPLPAG